MSNVDVKFRNFCTNFRMPKQSVDTVKYRYNCIQGCLNVAFWGGFGYHTRYVGSYGRVVSNQQ